MSWLRLLVFAVACLVCEGARRAHSLYSARDTFGYYTRSEMGRSAATIAPPGISYAQTYSSVCLGSSHPTVVSTLRHRVHPVPVPMPYPRKRQALWSRTTRQRYASASRTCSTKGTRTCNAKALVVVVIVVVLTLTRIFKSVVTEQALVTLERKNTPGKNTSKPKVVH